MTGLEQKVEATSKLATAGGSATAVVGGLALNEWGVVIGIIVGLTGLGFQIWLGLTRNKRERELHRRRMAGKDDP